MIKQAVLLSLSLLATSMAFAASELDDMLQSLGLVDESYEYTDEALATEFFRVATNEYAKSLPSQLNVYIQLDSAMMTAYTGRFNAVYTLPFTLSERESIKQELSTIETLREACLDYYLPNEFMVANNYNLTYAFHDENHRPLAEVKMNVLSCYDALTQ